jgi:invasion protein IalB
MMNYAPGGAAWRGIMRKLLIATAVSVLIGPVPALAQNAQQTQQPTAKPAKDPNEIVCERQEVIGSRLATQRVCKTRAEWAEEKRLNRMDVEKAQTLRSTDSSH